MKKKTKKVKKAKPTPKLERYREDKKKTAKKPKETMDRKTLKEIVSQLKEMGSDVKVFVSDTDEALQKKVNEALQKLPPPDVMKKLESIVPDKLVQVLKRDCLGIFVDLSDVSCVRCKDNQACVAAFLANVKGGLPGLQDVMAGPDTDKEKPVKAKAKLAPVTRYDAKRLVFVRDVKNPNPSGDDYHDTLQRVLDDQPETLAELREIVEQDFDVETDGDFMKFVTAMRDPAEGVIKLDVDLSDKNKAELRRAGYDV